LSICRQCELLGLARSSFYYEPVPETVANLALMRLIDQRYTDCPFYGSRKMTIWLQGKGHTVNRKRVQRLMRLMGLEAVYPKPKLSVAGQGHKVFPYLLRGVTIGRVGQVGSTDITYVPLASGFMYLAAVIDWFSRYVIAWRLSNTLDGAFCLEMLDEALAGGRPEVFNTDQGVQFTATVFTGRLEAAGVAVSMDGKGRCLDNVFVERLWRTVKYEDIYLRGYETVPALTQGLERYFPFYYSPSYCPSTLWACFPDVRYLDFGPMRFLFRRRARSTTCRAASVSRSERRNTHGPSDSGCSDGIFPLSAASRRVLAATPRTAAASVKFSQPSAA
jgi:putative transposase